MAAPLNEKILVAATVVAASCESVRISQHASDAIGRIVVRTDPERGQPSRDLDFVVPSDVALDLAEDIGAGRPMRFDIVLRRSQGRL